MPVSFDRCYFRDSGNLLLQLLVDVFRIGPDVVPRSCVILAMFSLSRYAYLILA